MMARDHVAAFAAALERAARTGDGGAVVVPAVFGRAAGAGKPYGALSVRELRALAARLGLPAARSADGDEDA